MRRIHWALVIVVVLGEVVAATTLPASAQPQVPEFSGEVTAGQTIKLECPEGYRVQFNEFFANASRDFWRNPNRKGKPSLTCRCGVRTKAATANNYHGGALEVPSWGPGALVRQRLPAPLSQLGRQHAQYDFRGNGTGGRSFFAWLDPPGVPLPRLIVDVALLRNLAGQKVMYSGLRLLRSHGMQGAVTLNQQKDIHVEFLVIAEGILKRRLPLEASRSYHWNFTNHSAISHRVTVEDTPIGIQYP